VSAPGAVALFPAFRPGASALHSARAGVGAAFCAALALVFVVFEHPLIVGAGVAAVVVAAWGAGAAPELARAARLAVAVALLVVVVNPLLSSDGTTVLVRGPSLLGHPFDVTLEAVAYGAVAGLRLVGLILACALFSATVDPDDLLRSLRRVSPRSALTAALAVRLVPVLARDASRRSEAARSRVRPARRTALARAALAGSLERAIEVAAALEVRGYGTPARATGERPWTTRGLDRTAPRAHRRSRHDARVGATAVAIAAVAVVAAMAGAAPFAAYPRLELAWGIAEIALAAAIVCLAGAPFVGAGARLGVAGADRAAVEGLDG